jgi:hypothetical protein
MSEPYQLRTLVVCFPNNLPLKDDLFAVCVAVTVKCVILASHDGQEKVNRH